MQTLQYAYRILIEEFSLFTRQKLVVKPTLRRYVAQSMDWTIMNRKLKRKIIDRIRQSKTQDRATHLIELFNQYGEQLLNEELSNDMRKDMGGELFGLQS